MHQDGTLYFGSDGLPGLGDFDIFKSELKDEKVDEATEPWLPNQHAKI